MKMAGVEQSRKSSVMALFAFLFSIFSIGSCSSQVPLLMWSSDGYSLTPLASPSAGHITSNSQWLSYLNSAMGPGPHNVILFLQEKLSKDDFTMYGGVFGNKKDSVFPYLESALRASPSQLVLPALAWPGSSAIPAQLQEKLGVSPLLVDPDTLAHLHLNASASNLLIINLPYSAGTSMSCKQVLKTNDEVIGKVLSIMKGQNVPYISIYTGLKPSRVIAEVSAGQPKGRSLLQAVEDTVKAPLMFNDTEGRPCIMLWAQDLNVSFGTGLDKWVNLANFTPTMDGSRCNSNTSQLVLNYESLPLYTSVRLTFIMNQRRYPVSGRNWFTLNNVVVVGQGETATFNGSRGVYAPSEYSFHCQSVSSVRDALLVPATDEIPQWKLNFIDFQIQGFNILNGTTDFSYASDCAGFFTPAIWMGLITSLIMLLILTYGLHMIMQVHTMDRFDDPKGPSISVPLSE
ncbi:V-type proton ATPase subunit S1b [Osmerus mordax]|uniref:V-type proton ATPase subunit S1b n=1 Tax=Osmerus mordax TaxID=8014 RepID=UPI00350F3458